MDETVLNDKYMTFMSLEVCQLLITVHNETLKNPIAFNSFTDFIR